MGWYCFWNTTGTGNGTPHPRERTVSKLYVGVCWKTLCSIEESRESGRKAYYCYCWTKNETGKENPSETGIRVLKVGRKTLQTGRVRYSWTFNNFTNHFRSSLATCLCSSSTFARLLQLACLCSSSAFACLLQPCLSLQFFLEELSPNVVFTALVGSENSWWNLLFVSKKVDLVDLELLAVDLVDLK